MSDSAPLGVLSTCEARPCSANRVSAIAASLVSCHNRWTSRRSSSTLRSIPSTVIVDSEVGDTLASDMIEVHGTEAATIARDNARAAALAAQIPEAKAWIRVLGIIQRIRPDHGLDP